MKNGCPWNEQCCYQASANGKLEYLKYLHENGCPWNDECCDVASQYGHMECLKYLYDNGCPWSSWDSWMQYNSF